MTLSRLPLSYCTNVHPGRTVDEVVEGLTTYSAEVQRQLDFPMAAGLWLSADVVRGLTESPEQLERLAQVLWQHDLCCYTLNTFPYGDFHRERVKEQVYLPDWTSSARINYTERSAAILGQLLPEGGEGSLSTGTAGGSHESSRRGFSRCLLQSVDSPGEHTCISSTKQRAAGSVWVWNLSRCAKCQGLLNGLYPCSSDCSHRRKPLAVSRSFANTSGSVSMSVIRRLSLKMLQNPSSSLSCVEFESIKSISRTRLSC